MASKNKNPYTAGSKYAAIHDAIRAAGQKGITRSELIEAGFTVSDITVVLSPRKEGVSTRGGDPRGNLSSQGHLYYCEKRKKAGEPARFVNRWRKVPLEKRIRPIKKDVASQKTSKAKASKASKTKTVKAAKAAVTA